MTARLSGPRGSLRLEGVLAVAAGGRLRAEVGTVSVTAPLILAAGPGGVSAALPSHRLVHHDPTGLDLFVALTGLAAEPGAIARLLTGEEAPLPPGCRWKKRSPPQGPCGPAATPALEIRCAEGRLRLRFGAWTPIDPPSDPFAPLERPAGWREAPAEEIAAAILGASPAR